jgi:hypothetical protein
MHVLLVYGRLSLKFHTAVRKNRYVILPVDFEEAWKVCCLSIVWLSHMTAKFAPFFSSTSKRSNEQTTLTNSVRTTKLFCVHRSLIHLHHPCRSVIRCCVSLLHIYVGSHTDIFHRLASYITFCNLIITFGLPCDCKKTLFHFSVSPHPSHGVALILLSNIKSDQYYSRCYYFAPLACRCRIAKAVRFTRRIHVFMNTFF